MGSESLSYHHHISLDVLALDDKVQISNGTMTTKELRSEVMGARPSRSPVLECC